ncbi:RNA 3'-terminal phosphate cyclase/enolpyruvate transferase [Xylariaceae sp. FL0255]|nr:RNA 3'-terminal phosphate cyclase/enolpyruvate transferase [Xylariaceae sp. FL0255]
MVGEAPSARTEDTVDIDGSMYEGGGGLIRYATSYSCLLNRPIRIHSIRANRPGVPGLRFEHTVAIDALRKLAGANVEGNVVKSCELRFTPQRDLTLLRNRTPASMEITVKGSACILLLALLPYILFSQIVPRVSGSTQTSTKDQAIELVIRAGTLCVKAPSIFYMRQVLIPTLKLIGIGEENLFLSEEYEQGWHTQGLQYPGKIVMRLKPLSQPLVGFVLQQRGRILKLRATAHVPQDFLQDFDERLRTEIADLLMTKRPQDSHVEVDIHVFASPTRQHYHLLLAAETTFPVAFLGYEEVYPQPDRFPPEIEDDPAKIAEYLIRGCIRGIWKELRRGNSVDENMEDLLVMYQTLASGFSSVASSGTDSPVLEFNSDSEVLNESGQVYDIDASTMHRQTSWWIAKHMINVQFEHRVESGRELRGCIGIGHSS